VSAGGGAHNGRPTAARSRRLPGARFSAISRGSYGYSHDGGNGCRNHQVEIAQIGDYSRDLPFLHDRRSASTFSKMAIGDVSTGVGFAQRDHLGATVSRERIGEGQFVETSLLDCSTSYHEVHVQVLSASKETMRPRRTGSFHYLVARVGIYGAGRIRRFEPIRHEKADLYAPQWRNRMIGCQQSGTLDATSVLLSPFILLRNRAPAAKLSMRRSPLE
jgi:hypothetical protein